MRCAIVAFDAINEINAFPRQCGDGRRWCGRTEECEERHFGRPQSAGAHEALPTGRQSRYGLRREDGIQEGVPADGWVQEHVAAVEGEELSTQFLEGIAIRRDLLSFFSTTLGRLSRLLIIEIFWILGLT